MQNRAILFFPRCAVEAAGHLTFPTALWLKGELTGTAIVRARPAASHHCCRKTTELPRRPRSARRCAHLRAFPRSFSRGLAFGFHERCVCSQIGIPGAPNPKPASQSLGRRWERPEKERFHDASWRTDNPGSAMPASADVFHPLANTSPWFPEGKQTRASEVLVFCPDLGFVGIPVNRGRKDQTR